MQREPGGTIRRMVVLGCTPLMLRLVVDWAFFPPFIAMGSGESSSSRGGFMIFRAGRIDISNTIGKVSGRKRNEDVRGGEWNERGRSRARTARQEAEDMAEGRRADEGRRAEHPEEQYPGIDSMICVGMLYLSTYRKLGKKEFDGDSSGSRKHRIIRDSPDFV
eukprot:1496039-Rhodomonas_salina.3